MKNNIRTIHTTSSRRPTRKAALWGTIAASSAMLVFAGCSRDRDDTLTQTDATQRDSAAVAYNTPPSTATGAATGASTGTASSTAAATGQTERDSAQVVLHEETLDVQKRQVDAGGVVVRTDVVTEEVQQPVELRRERVEVSHISPEEAQVREDAGEAFQETEIYIPLQREEAVVQKDVHARDVLNVQTETDVAQEQISETVRREVADVERQGEAMTEQFVGTAAATENQSTDGLQQRIREDLRNSEEFALSEEQLNNIEIEVQDNTVTLAGTVPNEQIANQIEMRVSRIDGVENVENELEAQDTVVAE